MKKDILILYSGLLRQYGPQGWWPLLELGDVTYEPGSKEYGGYHPGNYSYPKNDGQRFEICVGAILTQNTAWNNVVRALSNLREINALSADKLHKLTDNKLKQRIKPAGYFNQKSKKLRIFTEFFIQLNGKEPSRKELLDLWGIGPETADSILLYAYKQPEFVVDAYTKRLLLRMGLISGKAKYAEMKALFEDKLEKDFKLFQEYHALIVEHAKGYKHKL